MNTEHKSTAAVMLKIIDKGIETIDPENQVERHVQNSRGEHISHEYHPNGAWDSKWSPLLEKIRNQKSYEEYAAQEKQYWGENISYEQYAERQKARKMQESLIAKNTVILPCGKNLPGWYWEVTPDVPFWTKEFDAVLPEREETQAAQTKSNWKWTAQLYNQQDTQFCKIEFSYKKNMSVLMHNTYETRSWNPTEIYIDMRDGRFAHLNDAEKLPYITENETRSEVNEMRREEGGTEFLEYIDVDTVFTEAGKDSRNKTFPTKESDSLDTYGAAFCKNHSISEYCRSFENSVPQLLRESQEIMRQNPKRNEVLQIQLSKSEFKGTDFEKFCTGNKEIPQMLVCNQVRSSAELVMQKAGGGYTVRSVRFNKKNVEISNAKECKTKKEALAVATARFTPTPHIYQTKTELAKQNQRAAHTIDR